MSQIDEELLEVFKRINSKQKIRRQQSQEQFSDDDELVSYSSLNSTNEPTTNLNSVSTQSNSSLSHSSSNASSTSVPIQSIKRKFSSTTNLKNFSTNSSNQSFNYRKDYSNHPISQIINRHIQQSNNHILNNLINNQKLNGHQLNSNQINEFNKHNSIMNHQSNQMDSIKSIDLIDEQQETTRASVLIERMNSLTMNDSSLQSNINKTINNLTINKLDKKTSELLSISSDLNDAIIEEPSQASLEKFAKHSSPSDSNISDANSDSNCNSYSNGESIDQEEINQVTNIKLNPWIQQDKRLKNLFRAAKEIRDSESNYVDCLNLICVKYKDAVKHTINESILDKLLQPFDIIFKLNNVLLSRFDHCIENWEKTPKIANVLVDLGPFLKHYADFFTKYEQISNNFAEMKRKHPAFREMTEKFEQQPICHKLTLAHYMLKPIQRIGQYKLLVDNYLKYLKEDAQHPDYKNAIKAKEVVSKAAEFSNERMKENENFSKLLAIQHCIIGGYEIIKPYRRLIKQSILHKASRKQKQERLFILCNDCLIYLTIIKENTYKVNHELSLINMRLSTPEQEAFRNEILVISLQRSIRIVCSSLEEKEEWMNEINAQIQQLHSTMKRRPTLIDQQNSLNNNDIERPLSLGEEAPIWVLDERVTMCWVCTGEFTLTNRRHHCRACGKIVCNKCSKQTHYLVYLKRKHRVCNRCFDTLTKHAIPETSENINDEEQSKLNDRHLSKLSSSDSNLNKLIRDNSVQDPILAFPTTQFKIRRNSSNLTSISSRSSKSSIFFENEPPIKDDEDLIYNNDKESSIYKRNSITISHYNIKTNSNNDYINNNNDFIGSDKPINNDDQTSNLALPPTSPQPDTFQRINKNRNSGRKKPIPKVLTEVSANDTEFDIAGYMFKRKSKKNWKRSWFVLKSHVLYSFKESENVAAEQSLPILGYTVQISQISIDGCPANLIIQLRHQNLPDQYFRLDTERCVEKWFKALQEAATTV